MTWKRILFFIAFLNRAEDAGHDLSLCRAFKTPVAPDLSAVLCYNQAKFVPFVNFIHSNKLNIFLIGERNIYQTPSMHHTTTSLIL